MSASDRPSPFAAGLRSRCPACGRGPLFEGFLSVRERCPACGAELSAQDSGDGPAAFIVLIALHYKHRPDDFAQPQG